MRLRALWYNKRIVLYFSLFLFAATYIVVAIVTTLGTISVDGTYLCAFPSGFFRDVNVSEANTT